MKTNQANSEYNTKSQCGPPAKGSWSAALVTPLLLLLAASAPAAFGATLTTDKPDYAPGSYVTFIGSEWAAGETVTIDIYETISELDAPIDTLSAVADADGHFANNEFAVVESYLGLGFLAVATGPVSGIATATFTDDKPRDPIYPPHGAAPVTPPTTHFQIDGDLIASGGVGDWISVPDSAAGVLYPTALAEAKNTATTYHLRDAYNTSADVIFTGTGDKFNDDPTTWNLNAQSSPDKIDIENACLHLATSDGSDGSPAGSTWMILSGDRYSENGDA